MSLRINPLGPVDMTLMTKSNGTKQIEVQLVSKKAVGFKEVVWNLRLGSWQDSERSKKSSESVLGISLQIKRKKKDSKE